MPPHRNQQFDTFSPPQQQQPQQPGTAGVYDSLLPQLLERMSNHETKFAQFSAQCTERMKTLEQLVKEKSGSIDRYNEEHKQLREDFVRMEQGLLNEFRISQSIMQAMIEHDMSIEKAKLEMKQQIELKDKEMQNKQKEAQLANEQARKDLVRQMWVRIGVVVLPIATALATLLSNVLPSLFGK